MEGWGVFPWSCHPSESSVKETHESPDQRGRDEEGAVQRGPYPAARAHVGFVTRTNLNTKKERRQRI